jgi:uncharacterized membrane protein
LIVSFGAGMPQYNYIYANTLLRIWKGFAADQKQLHKWEKKARNNERMAQRKGRFMSRD